MARWMVTPTSVNVDPGFWRDRRVLVTGHTGFKGAWLSLWLARLGARVTGVALEPIERPNLFEALDLKAMLRSHFADVRDLGCLGEIVHTAEPEVLLHLAGQAIVRTGYDDPVTTFETNVIGTVNTLEIARRSPALRAVVIVTSDKCYQNDGRSVGYVESDRLGGDDPYSSSKACAELVSASYRESFFQNHSCSVATARAGNAIGGGDWSRGRLVPDVVRSVFGNERLQLRNPDATRPWQHVLEPLSGYLILAQQLSRVGPQYAGPWNFGPSSDGSVSVSELAAAILAASDRPVDWDAQSVAALPESRTLKLETSKARELLGWRCRLSQSEAVRWTVEWYQAWHLGDSVARISANQIDCYERILRAE